MEALNMFLLLLHCCFNQKQSFVVEIAQISYIYIQLIPRNSTQVNGFCSSRGKFCTEVARKEAWEWGWTQSMMQSVGEEHLKSVWTEEGLCEATAEDELCLCSLVRGLCWGEMQAALRVCPRPNTVTEITVQNRTEEWIHEFYSISHNPEWSEM